MDVFLPLAVGFCLGSMLTVCVFVIAWKPEPVDVRTHQAKRNKVARHESVGPGQYVPSTCKLHPLRNIGRKEV